MNVVLLHGLGARPWTLALLAAYLRYHGYDTYVPAYPIDDLDTEEMLAHVDALLAQRFNRAEELVVIGQSMGGVVAFRLHEYGWNIRRAISIGSPLHGARLLHQLEGVLPTCVRDYLYKRPYDDLKRAARTPAPPHDYRTITLSWAGFDGFDGCVYRDEAMIDPARNLHLPWADHRTVFANPRLCFHVLKLVEAGGR